MPMPVDLWPAEQEDEEQVPFRDVVTGAGVGGGACV